MISFFLILGGTPSTFHYVFNTKIREGMIIIGNNLLLLGGSPSTFNYVLNTKIGGGLIPDGNKLLLLGGAPYKKEKTKIHIS